MGPLLVWAMRVVDDLAEGILTAWAERQRLTDIARTSTATIYKNKIVLARRYIGGITGASANQIEGLVAAVAQRPGPCPLDVAVSGRIAGRPWRSTIDFNEAPTLMRHLTTGRVHRLQLPHRRPPR